MAHKSYGVFTRAGQARRVAGSPAEAVQLEYDGWTRIADAVKPTPKPAEDTAPTKAAAAKTTTKP